MTTIKQVNTDNESHDWLMQNPTFHLRANAGNKKKNKPLDLHSIVNKNTALTSQYNYNHLECSL